MNAYDLVKKHYKSMNKENNFTIVPAGSHGNWMDFIDKMR